MSLNAPRLTLFSSNPEYADKNEGNKTDWLFLPNPKGKPFKSPFSKLFGFVKSIPFWAASLLEIVSLLALNCSKTFEEFSSLLEKAVLIKMDDILKLPILSSVKILMH